MKMANTLKCAYSLATKFVSSSGAKVLTLSHQPSRVLLNKCAKLSTNTECLMATPAGSLHWSRAHSTLSSSSSSLLKSCLHTDRCGCTECTRQTPVNFYSTEVEQELSKFLEKEIKYEKSRSHPKLPPLPGFDIATDGGDVTLTKINGNEKIVVKLSVNGAVDALESENPKEEEPPQMVCRPFFQVEVSKAGTVLALKCGFPSSYSDYEDEQDPKGKSEDEQDDQFQIHEVSIHSGESGETTYSVQADVIDPDLFDLLMDLLDERGINDVFADQLVDFCTAYESTLYVGFLQNLKAFAEK